MAYLGRVKPVETTASVTRATYTGNGSTTTFNLPRSVSNETEIVASVNGVVEQDAAYSTNGTQIIFDGAPALGDAIELRVLGGLGLGYAPPDGSVVTGKLGDGAVTLNKMSALSVDDSKIVNNTITGTKLASGAAVTNIGYTPMNRQGGIYFPSSARYANGGSDASLLATPSRKTWFKFVTSEFSGSRYLHIKTNYFLGFDGFWSIKGYGYHYGRAMTVNSQWVGYAYSNGGGAGIHTLIATNQQNYGQHNLASNSYKSADQFLVIVADLTAGSGNTYFIGFELDFYQSTNSFSNADISATATSITNSTTGAY